MAPVKTPFWSRPWSHAHAWVLLAGCLAVAFALQAMHPRPFVAMPGHPWNHVLAGVTVVAGVVAGRFWPGFPAVRFLGSGAWAIAALAGLAIASWPLAVVPVGALAPPWLQRMGLGDPLSSPAFAVALTSIVVNLAVSVGRRISPLGEGGLAVQARFVVLHAGLLLAVAGGAAAHGGLQRTRFILEEGAAPGVLALAEDGTPLVLPFSLRLDDFVLDRFPPMLLVGDADGTLHRGEVLMGPDAEDRIRGLRIRVVEWLAAASVPGTVPIAFRDEAANPAARVEVSSADGTVIASGWLHPPGPIGGSLSVALPDGRAVHLESPRARGFLAKVRSADPAGQVQPAEITVNHPLRRDGWAVYILGYDESLGPASRTAVFEAVEDHALPVVYAGIALILAGVVWHLWLPRRETRP